MIGCKFQTVFHPEDVIGGEDQAEFSAAFSKAGNALVTAKTKGIPSKRFEYLLFLAAIHSIGSPFGFALSLT